MMMRLLVSSAMILILAGCLKTRAELESEQSDFQQEQQTQSQQRAHASEKVVEKPVYKEKAPATAYRFEEYDEQMRNLNGRVDALENGAAQMQNTRKEDREGMNKNTLIVQQKFDTYEEALKKLEAEVKELTEEVNKLKAAPPPAPVAVTGKLTSPEVPSGGKLKTSYDEGEELFVAKKWKEAILSFQKYRDANPKGKLYAESTYKIGVSFQELGMKEDAKAFYEEVTAKFPKSKEAKKAAVRLKTLK